LRKFFPAVFRVFRRRGIDLAVLGGAGGVRQHTRRNLSGSVSARPNQCLWQRFISSAPKISRQSIIKSVSHGVRSLITTGGLFDSSSISLFGIVTSAALQAVETLHVGQAPEFRRRAGETARFNRRGGEIFFFHGHNFQPFTGFNCGQDKLRLSGSPKFGHAVKTCPN
jgi:hypothetical protein